MTHLFVLWFALFAAQASTPATPPPSEPPATQPTQQPAPVTPSTPSPDQAAPACNNCPTPAVQHVQPFTAKTHATTVQTRADGTTVTTVTEGQIWHDADGRERSERIRTPPNEAPSHFISIYDPVTRINLSWKVGDPSVPKVVNLTHIQQPVPQPAQSTPITPQTAPSHYPTKSESLPPQTILGFKVLGFRRTLTIPAGVRGSDHDVTITTEYWYAPSLNMQLRNITDDPINGKTTTETTDIQFVDPDPALFQPPDDYQLKEVNPPIPNPDATGTYQSGDGITPPRVLYQPEPKFPKIAKKQKLQGVSMVSIIVDIEGNPRNVHLKRPMATDLDKEHEAAALALDQAALDAVKKYKFKPATIDGKPVPVYLNVEVNFEIF